MTKKKLKFLKTLSFSLMFGIFAFNSAALAGTYYVKKSGNDSNDGLTWNTAFATITKAVNSATRNDEIRVGAGTYAENISIRFDNISLYGSYPANGGDVQDYEKNITIIDGQNKGRVINADSGIYLDGFTITNGNAGYGDGGGVYYGSNGEISHCNFIKNSARNGGGIAFGSRLNSQPGVTDCTFTENTATEQGGATYQVKYISDCTFTRNSSEIMGGAIFEAEEVSYCTFIENNSDDGGAIFSIEFVSYSTFTKNSAGYDGGAITYVRDVSSSTFTENTAGEHGGAISRLEGGDGLRDCTFIKNTAGNQGGAVHRVSPLLSNCVFKENKAGTGGGVYEPAISTTITIEKCTFEGNEATDDGGAIKLEGEAYYSRGNVSILNSTFTSNHAKIGGGLFLDVYGGWRRVKHCTFVDNVANDGKEIYTASRTADEFLNCIIWNANGNPINYVNQDNDNGWTTFTNCAMRDETSTENFNPIYIENFSSSHSPEKVSVNEVEHTVFKLNANDTELIQKGKALTFKNDDVMFYDDQIEVSRNLKRPTIGAIEYQRNSNNDDYGSDNSDNSDSSNISENTSVVRKGSSSGCNSGVLIYGLILVSGLLMKRK